MKKNQNKVRKLISKDETKIISIFLNIYLLMQPIIDALTYLNLRYNVMIISISSVIRAFIFILILLYLLSKKKNKKDILILIGYFLIYFLIQGFYLKSGIITSINTLLTIFYLPILVSFFNSVKLNKKYFNLKIIMITYFIYLGLIIIPYLFKYGNYASSSYEGKNGFYGLFYGGNEISNILVVMLPLVLTYLVKGKNYLYIILTFLGLFISIYLIGTKTLILGSIIISIYFLYKYLWPIYKNLKKKSKLIILISFAILIIFCLFLLPHMAVTKNIIRAIDYYGFNINNIFSLNGLDKLVFSGRLSVLKSVAKLYFTSSLPTILMGLNKTYINIFKGIEIDFFDIFFSLGLIGFIVYLYISIKALKKEKLTDIYLFTFILSIMISLVTGHILNTPNVSIYIGLLFCLNKQEE